MEPLRSMFGQRQHGVRVTVRQPIIPELIQSCDQPGRGDGGREQPVYSDQIIRVLVVDDTAVYRMAVAKVLEESPGIEVVGTACNGKMALAEIERLKPDVVTLDLEMPELDGLGVLRALKAAAHPIGVIMLSAFTETGAQATVTALELGAFDFVLKPQSRSIEESEETIRRKLVPKIEAYIATVRPGWKPQEKPAQTLPSQHPSSAELPSVSKRLARVATGGQFAPDVVVLGISTGGPDALARMMPKLPGDMDVPMLIVQHMPPKFTQSLASSLNNKCALHVCEAEEGQVPQPGQALIAPGGRQMKLCKTTVGGDTVVAIELTDDAPEHSCRPSVDYLFRSAVEVYSGNILAVIMTGMGNDGAAGCRLIKEHGGQLITQDEASCVVYGMPREPAEAGLSDVVLPLEDIAEHIAVRVRRRVGCP